MTTEKTEEKERGTKMGSAARLPKSIRKHVREAKARIRRETSSPGERSKRLSQVYATLGVTDLGKNLKAKRKQSKRRKAHHKARALAGKSD